MLRRLATTTTLLLAAATLAAPTGAATAAARAPQVRVTGTNTAFSPNGDGSKDLGVVRYQLGRRADVTVRVSSRTGTVLSRHVGRLAAGTHYFTWNGILRGRVVADGTYSVGVVARKTRRAAPTVARTPLVVDARYGTQAGTVRLSNSTVYPRTTVTRDVVVGNFFPVTQFFRDDPSPRQPYSASPYYGRGRYDYISARRQVLDSRGHVVDSGILVTAVGESDGQETVDLRTPCPNGCGRFTWDGRTSTGAVAAPGAYRIRVVQGQDRAGNPRVVAPPVSVRVSASKLVARTTSRTVAASAPERLPFSTANDNVHAGTTPAADPSTRSYDSSAATCSSTDTRPCVARDRFVLPFTGRRTPTDTVSVVAHGTPRTSGGTGTLTVGRGDDAQSTTTTGDSPTTIGRGPFAANTEVPGQTSGLQWSFQVAYGNAYDVTSFDVTWTTYVLP